MNRTGSTTAQTVLLLLYIHLVPAQTARTRDSRSLRRRKQKSSRSYLTCRDQATFVRTPSCQLGYWLPRLRHLQRPRMNGKPRVRLVSLLRPAIVFRSSIATRRMFVSVCLSVRPSLLCHCSYTPDAGLHIPVHVGTSAIIFNLHTKGGQRSTHLVFSPLL